MSYNFREAILSNRLHHAFIIEGPLSFDKVKYALDTLKAVVCTVDRGDGCGICADCRKIENGNYADLYMIEASGGIIKVQEIVNVQKKLSNKPIEKKKVCLIKDADKMNMNGYNRLLKTLEEPTADTILFLLSENSAKIPDTILSRCIRISVPEKYRLEKNAIGYEEAKNIIESLIGKEYFYKVKDVLEKFAKDKERAYILLDNMQQIYRDIMIGVNNDFAPCSMEHVFRGIEAIEIAREEIDKNIRVSYALKKMVLCIGG